MWVKKSRPNKGGVMRTHYRLFTATEQQCRSTEQSESNHRRLRNDLNREGRKASQVRGRQRTTTNGNRDLSGFTPSKANRLVIGTERSLPRADNEGRLITRSSTRNVHGDGIQVPIGDGLSTSASRTERGCRSNSCEVTALDTEQLSAPFRTRTTERIAWFPVSAM